MTLYIGYIYKYSFPNGKIYIGQTSRSVLVRFNEHLYCANNKKGYYLHSAIRKYGKDNIGIKVICTVGAYTIELLEVLLNKLEIFFIKYYNSRVPNGYNTTEGGNSKAGYIHTEEAKKKISLSNKGKVFTDEHRRNLSKGLKGHKVSLETKYKISKANKGRICPQHVKESISKTLKGKSFSLEHRDKISLALAGRTYSLETILKMKDSKVRVIQLYNKEGTLLATYTCIEEASKQTGISTAAIYKCACGKNKTSGGYVWKYTKN